MATQII